MEPMAAFSVPGVQIIAREHLQARSLVRRHSCSVGSGRLRHGWRKSCRMRNARLFMTVEDQTADGVSLHGLYVDKGTGVVRLSGADGAKFLHNMSTNNLTPLAVGQARLTTLTTNIGRTVDLVTVLVDDSGLILLTSDQKTEETVETFDRFIFPADKVEIENISQEKDVIHVLSPLSDNSFLPVPSPGTFVHCDVSLGDTGNVHVIVCANGPFSSPGLTIVIDHKDTEFFLQYIQQLDGPSSRSISPDEWEIARVREGRPQVNKELTLDYNPLEAGLWKTVSFKKGCYIGQETIAKLKTYDGVKQNLFGLDLDRTVEEGTELRTMDGEERVGVVTSCVQSPSGKGIGLAYIRRKVYTLTEQLKDKINDLRQLKMN